MTLSDPVIIRLQPIFLVVTAAGLMPIALAYGVVPGSSLPWLFGIDAGDVNTRHIFRAVMGLYLALIGFWLAGAAMPHLRRPALWSLFIFMIGLAFGRVISIAIDGWPNALLVFYLFLEVTFGAAGWLMLRPVARGTP